MDDVVRELVKIKSLLSEILLVMKEQQASNRAAIEAAGRVERQVRKRAA